MKLYIKKIEALPSTLDKDTMYLTGSSEDGLLVVHVTDSTGHIVKSTPDSTGHISRGVTTIDKGPGIYTVDCRSQPAAFGLPEATGSQTIRIITFIHATPNTPGTIIPSAGGLINETQRPVLIDEPTVMIVIDTGHGMWTMSTGGKDGIDGADGMVGPMGPTGPVGCEGPKGDRGAAGHDGEVGPMGLTGEQGPMGPIGPMGPQGSTGDVIDVGLKYMGNGGVDLGPGIYTINSNVDDFVLMESIGDGGRRIIAITSRTNNLTIHTNGTDTINGATSIDVAGNDVVYIVASHPGVWSALYDRTPTQHTLSITQHSVSFTNSNIWLVTHNQNRVVPIVVMDVNGNEMISSVTHTINDVTISHGNNMVSGTVTWDEIS